MANIYDNEEFFQSYAEMTRSRKGLSGAGEWHQFKEMFPHLLDLHVLDLGCGYGWHCKYVADHGAARVLGIEHPVFTAGVNQDWIYGEDGLSQSSTTP